MPTPPLSRRSMLAAAAAGAIAPSLTAQDSTDPPKRGIRNGRINQAGVQWCYGGPLDELAELCAALGASGVDVVRPNDWSILKKHGLVCTLTPCIERGFGPSRGLNRAEDHESHLEVIRERMAANDEAGFRNLLVFSGNRAEGLSDEEGLRNCAAALRVIAPEAEAKGQVILIENLNSKRDHRGYMFDRMAWGLELIQAVGSPAVKILYDIYHAQIMEGDVIATIRAHHESIGHYHTAGVPGRGNIDETQELYYPAIMEAIAETGFEGYVAQEFRPSGDRKAAMAHAFELCDV